MFQLFRIPQHQRFEYKPRFYNPEKENLDGRIAQALQKEGTTVDGLKIRISDGLRRRGHGYGGHRKKLVFRSNVILISIIIILLVLSYIALDVYLPYILQYLE